MTRLQQDHRREFLATVREAIKDADREADDLLTAILALLLMEFEDGEIQPTSLAGIERRVQERFKIAANRISGVIEQRLPAAARNGVGLHLLQLREDELLAMARLIEAQQEQIVTGTVVRGRTLGYLNEPVSQHITRIVNDTGGAVMRSIRRASLTNQTVGQLDRQLKLDILGATRKSQTQPATALMPNLSRAILWEYVLAQKDAEFHAGELLPKKQTLRYRWRLGDVQNHCQICLGRNGNVYPVGDPVWEHLPQHRSCGCWAEPVYQ